MVLEKLILFDHLNNDGGFGRIIQLYKQEDMELHYYPLVRMLVDRGQSLKQYMVTMLLMSESKKLTRFEKADTLSEVERICLQHDIEILARLFHMDLADICGQVDDKYGLLKVLEDKDRDHTGKTMVGEYMMLFSSDKEGMDLVEGFLELVTRFGIGPYAFYPAFSVMDKEEVSLIGIRDILTLDWENIYHYPLQKEALLKNTKAFVEGQPFQNVLLVGASGTGKSTSVKSVINRFADRKLRLIQMQKGQLHLLPKVLERIEGRGFKFILFIDDLSFEANEDEYKFLKSFIEGSVSGDMSQVAFYVTSNRRHLIKEIRTERENDIHLQDFIQEMTSLSDRFGLTLLYEGLIQKEYYDMVVKMYGEQVEAGRMNALDEAGADELKDKARIYALRHGKMSGRVAMQFIKQLGADVVYETIVDHQ